MTTPNPRGLLAAPRQLAAWALIGYAGLHLFIAFLNWVAPRQFQTFAERSASACGTLTSLVELALPVVAVLIATWGDAPVAQARLIATIALVEYVVVLFLGALTFLIGLAGFVNVNGLDVLGYLLLGLGRLGLALIAGLVAYQTWTRLGGSLAALTRPSTPWPPSEPPASGPTYGGPPASGPTYGGPAA
ncbi:MAG: hypothetical protein IRY85_05745 [Micromonosporaceae bacterium]|nr:hypothetical protein [Micromonosporaceae bacterium]